MIRSMAVAFDHSDEAREALAVAMDLSSRLDVPLIVIHFIGLLDVARRSTINELDAIQEAVLKAALRLGLSIDDLSIRVRTLDSSPVEGVRLVVDDENIDLVVVGSRGHAIDDTLLGSTSHQLIEHLERPVLVVPHRR